MALFNSENLIENWLNGIVIGCFKKKMKENYILLWSNLTETLLNEVIYSRWHIQRVVNTRNPNLLQC